MENKNTLDEGFLKMLKEFYEGVMSLRKKPYNFYGHADEHEQQLHHLYLQYKIFKWTKWLVFATWALAIATIILAIIK
jgi:UDP-N-acetylmuramyl pentapeptide phosphotransferase/UDP-N-acetylglucosamine-1-phosphate transferase